MGERVYGAEQIRYAVMLWDFIRRHQALIDVMNEWATENDKRDMRITSATRLDGTVAVFDTDA